jgi:hypothetical protein
MERWGMGGGGGGLVGWSTQVISVEALIDLDKAAGPTSIKKIHTHVIATHALIQRHPPPPPPRTHPTHPHNKKQKKSLPYRRTAPLLRPTTRQEALVPLTATRTTRARTAGGIWPSNPNRASRQASASCVRVCQLALGEKGGKDMCVRVCVCVYRLALGEKGGRGVNSPPARAWIGLKAMN